MNERTIKICGQEVTLRYCAATETGFESLQAKSVSEINFNSSEDLIALGVCAIVASYSYRDEQPPIDSKKILYEAKPQELVALIQATIEARAEYYELPAVVKPDEPAKDDEDNPKNL